MVLVFYFKVYNKMSGQKRQNQAFLSQNHTHVQRQLAFGGQNMQYLQQNHIDVLEAINDTHENSNFDCEWIDNEQSPQKIANQSFPSDIQIGVDGINIGSNSQIQPNQRDLQINNVEFVLPGDLSLNEQFDQDQNLHKNKQKFELQDRSFLSEDCNFKGISSHLLDNDVLNNSKQDLFAGMQISGARQNDYNIFDVQNNMISQIQPSSVISDQNSNKSQDNQPIIDRQKCKKLEENTTDDRQSNEQKNVVQEQKLILQPQNLTQQKSKQQSKQQSIQKSRQQSQSKSSMDKQLTITINEKSFASTIFENSSAIDQSMLTKSMRSYLQASQSSYNPFYSTLEAIYNNSKIKSQKSLENFYMYSDFFKEKSKQFEKYLREMQSQKTQKLFQNLKKTEINNFVYVDSKVVLRDIHQKNIKKVKLYRVFYKQLVQMSSELKKNVAQVYERRHLLQKSVQKILLTIKALQNELQKFIQYRVNYEKHRQDPCFFINTKQIFKVENPHILNDQYLQIKLTIEKQAAYIRNLMKLRTEVIKYITLVFLTDQINLSANIKQTLINYTELLIQVEKRQKNLIQIQGQDNSDIDDSLRELNSKKQALQQRKIHDKLKVELGKKLQECLPQVLKGQIGLKSFTEEFTSEQLLELLNKHFQNQVFMTHIQMQNQFVLYRTEGKWFSKDEYKEAPQKNSFIKEKKQQTIDQQKNSATQKTMLTLVLTVNKYLHLQQNQKIATMKLSEIKISKKGKFIIISDRGKGIVGFLVHNGNELGRLQFKSSEEVDQFAGRIKQLLENK